MLLLNFGHESGPLHSRLYRRMRSLILDGSWPSGTKLPSSRLLARELGISRNTALYAIEMLVAEGWVHSRPGSAMYVSSDAPSPAAHLGPSEIARQPSRQPTAFEIGQQSAEFFPLERWNRLQTQTAVEKGSAIHYEADPGGWPQLCAAISTFVSAARGHSCLPEQVIVVSSTQVAIDLVMRALGEGNGEVWVEDPGYPLVHQLFRINGLSPIPITTDEEGIKVSEAVRIAPRARFAYVTPACQFPTGRSMSVSRRRQLLEWAAQNDSWIIEDDWEWHAQFAGASPPPLQSLPGGERVIYVQTFNRTTFPGLRLAFMIAPLEIVPDLLALNERVNGGVNVPLQATFARFLEDGLYAAHLRAARSAYGERRAALIAALDALPAGFAPSIDRNGLHVVVNVPESEDDAKLAASIRARGMACMAVSEFAIVNMTERGLVLGFAAFPVEQLRAAAAQLIEAISESVDEGAAAAAAGRDEASPRE